PCSRVVGTLQQNLSPQPPPRSGEGEQNAVFLPLSVSGRGLGGGVRLGHASCILGDASIRATVRRAFSAVRVGLGSRAVNCRSRQADPGGAPHSSSPKKSSRSSRRLPRPCL